MEVYDSILEVVGGTPLVRLSRLGRGLALTLLAKVEYLNLGGSVKDRIGLAMVERPSGPASSSRAARSWSRPAATPAPGWPSPPSRATACS